MERKRTIIRNRNPTAAIDVDASDITDKSVNNNGVSSTETGGSMRKPFSDIINFDLIPTETLRKLCSNSLSASEAQSILRKSLASKSRFSNFPPNSKTHIVCDSDSKSATSIGSSNFNTASKTQPKNPTPVPRSYSSSSSSKGISPTGKRCETVISSHPRAVDNLKGPKKTDVSPHVSTISKKTKNQENITPVLTPFEKAKDKGKTILLPSDSTPSRNTRDKGKKFSVRFSSPNVERTGDQGKAINVPSTSTFGEWRKDKGKAIAYEELEHVQKSIGNTRDKKKEVSVRFRSPNVEKTVNQGKAVNVSSTSTFGEKREDKGKAIAYEELEHVQKSTPVRINCQLLKPKEKRKADVMALSCPPRTLKTRNIGNELNQDDEKASKSWTDPRPKGKRMKYSRQKPFTELPEEFVKQQKAYFEEVDAFELPVEEVSAYDSE